MVRLLFVIVLLSLLAVGSVYISDIDGVVSISDSSLFPQDYKLPLWSAIIRVLALSVCLTLAYILIELVVTMPRKIRRGCAARAQRKGFYALTKSIFALNTGNDFIAIHYADRAEKLLKDSALPTLIKAQISQSKNDPEETRVNFKKLLKSEEARIVGLRGLYLEAKSAGKNEEAANYAEQALKEVPDAPWALEANLEMLCLQGNWSKAQTVLDHQVMHGFVDAAKGKRQRAVLMTAEALSLEESAPNRALTIVKSALKAAPNLVPAACLAAKLLVRERRFHRAAKIIEKAWILHPHPELARLYITMRPTDSALDRLNRARNLAEKAKYPVEGRQAIAKTALDAREFAEARKILEPLVQENPTVNVCLLMASIEFAELGAEGAARVWLARAARAPRDPAWIADGIISDKWEPFSPVTGKIDAFIWKAPQETTFTFADPVLEHIDTISKILPAGLTPPLQDNPAENAKDEEEKPLSDIHDEARNAVEKHDTVEKQAEKPALSTETTEAASKDEVVTAEAVKTEETQREETSSPSEKAETPLPEEEEKHPEITEDDAASVTEVPQEHSEEKEQADQEDNTGTDEQTSVFPLNRLPDDPGPEDAVEVKRKKRFGFF